VAVLCGPAGACRIRRRRAGRSVRLVYNKYFVDEAYDALIVNPIVDGSRVVLWRGVDAGLIDGAVDGAGTASRFIAAFCATCNPDSSGAMRPGWWPARSW